MKYLPFLSGKYTTAPGLVPVNKALNPGGDLIFQIDEDYDSYLNNKQVCRNENIHKYYCEFEMPDETIRAVNRYVAWQLVKVYPDFFELVETPGLCIFSIKKTHELFTWKPDWIKLDHDKYLSVFDMLASHLQEDLAICQLDNGKDWLAALHLCAPNHWGALDKIGKPFNKVHAPVPGMDRVFAQYPKMLEAIVNHGPFTRFAWGISTDTRLNHHPDAPKGVDHDFWYGRGLAKDENQFYIRTERQNLIGFPPVNGFLFTIRTYFYSINSLTAEEKTALIAAIESMSPETLEYKGLARTKETVITSIANRI